MYLVMQIICFLSAIFIVAGLPMIVSFIFHKTMRSRLKNLVLLGMLDSIVLFLVFYVIYFSFGKTCAPKGVIL